MSEPITSEPTTSEPITLDAPAALRFSEEDGAGGDGAGGGAERMAERPARLLEAGDYPDKRLTLTVADLDGIAARFAAGLSANGSDGGGVPVKVEHRDSPLDPLGAVRRVWREGDALLATLAFPEDLAAFLRRRGAAKLSVGLTRDPLRLQEVSLVLKPRVLSATLMSGLGDLPPAVPADPVLPPAAPADPSLGGKGEEGEAEGAASGAPTGLSPTPPSFLGKGAGGLGVSGAGGLGVLNAGGSGPSGLQSEVVRLRAELASREVEAHLAAFKAQGRIVPASEGPARALLASDGEATVTLADGPEPVARVFKRFLEAQPPAILLHEVGPAGAPDGADGGAFTQSEHTFLSKRLGVDPALVAARLKRERDARETQEKEESHAH